MKERDLSSPGNSNQLVLLRYLAPVAKETINCSASGSVRSQYKIAANPFQPDCARDYTCWYDVFFGYWISLGLPALSTNEQRLIVGEFLSH